MCHFCMWSIGMSLLCVWSIDVLFLWLVVSLLYVINWCAIAVCDQLMCHCCMWSIDVPLLSDQHTFTHTCMCAHTQACIYTHKNACMHTHMRACTHISHTHACALTHMQSQLLTLNHFKCKDIFKKYTHTLTHTQRTDTHLHTNINWSHHTHFRNMQKQAETEVTAVQHLY